MKKSTILGMAIACLVAFGITFTATAQEPAAGGAKEKKGPPKRPPLFFKEMWKQTPKGGEHEFTPDSVGNPALEVHMYGTDAKNLLLTGAADDDNNPIHPWTGMCTAACGVTLSDKNNMVDLTGPLAKIRWVTKISGFHPVRPFLKLADGTYLVGDHSDGSTLDWATNEFNLADVPRWLKVDAKRVVTTGGWITNPDLSKVDEVGYVDLMASSGHGQGGWLDVGMIEVYGKPVPRASKGGNQ